MKKFVERRLARERVLEKEQIALRKQVKDIELMKCHGEADFRVEVARRARETNEQKAEVSTEYAHVQAQQVATRKAIVSKMETDLAIELERRKAQAVREEQDRIRMYDGSEELRQIKTKLHQAQVNKERHQQLVEQLLRKEQEKQEEEEISQRMEYDRREAIEKKIADEIHKSQQRGKVTAINQQQIILREEAKGLSKIQAEKERQQVEAIVEQIAKEDALEAATRKRKQEETQVMLRAFMIEQQERQRKMEQDELDEMAAIEAFAKKKRALEEAQEEEKRKAEEAKKAAYELIVATAEARNKEAEEFEFLKNELYAEELEAQQRRKEELGMRKKLEDRAEMLKAYEDQLRLKEERRVREEREEAVFREKLLHKFAEDDRIEQLNAQKKRMKVQEHKREVERLLQERRAQYQAERDAELLELEEQRRVQKERYVEIEEEKKRLLREHCVQFRDYLPKGMFQNREDYDYVMAQPEPN
ncbi:unnamed protein product [Amoebophrya sp. A120]|nr:unnamed protein product [Amoebophrya sp. A120]|eukprot:GSA120T00011473001.1